MSLPVGVEHREPGGVAILSFDDHVLAKDAFEAETKPERGAARPPVEAVAFPFDAAVSENVERLRQHQVHGFGIDSRSLRFGDIPDMAELDDAHRGANRQIAHHAEDRRRSRCHARPGRAGLPRPRSPGATRASPSDPRRVRSPCRSRATRSPDRRATRRRGRPPGSRGRGERARPDAPSWTARLGSFAGSTAGRGGGSRRRCHFSMTSSPRPLERLSASRTIRPQSSVSSTKFPSGSRRAALTKNPSSRGG